MHMYYYTISVLYIQIRDDYYIGWMLDDGFSKRVKLAGLFNDVIS